MGTAAKDQLTPNVPKSRLMPTVLEPTLDVERPEVAPKSCWQAGHVGCNARAGGGGGFSRQKALLNDFCPRVIFTDKSACVGLATEEYGRE